MSEPFDRLLLHEPAALVVLAGAESFDANAVPRGYWPTEYGGPAQASILGEPLTSDRWSLEWQVPLGPASVPRCLLAGAGRVLATALDSRGMWRSDGSFAAEISVRSGLGFVDPDGARYFCDDGSGLVMHALDDGRRDARVRLAFPSAHETRHITTGPGGARVFLSADGTPHTPAPQVVVESFRIDDYTNKSARGVFYGLTPLGGLLRSGDSHARMAAVASGPVIATFDGVRFCDWHLQTVSDVPASHYPLTLSTDGARRAFVVCADEESARLVAFEPSGVVFDIALPWGASAGTPPPIVTSERLVLTPPGHLLILDREGAVILHEPRPAVPPATLTSNGILLLPHEKLLGVTPDGARFPLWSPPAPIRTAPVLVDGTVYVATADTLYALR